MYVGVFMNLKQLSKYMLVITATAGLITVSNNSFWNEKSIWYSWTYLYIIDIFVYNNHTTRDETQKKISRIELSYRWIAIKMDIFISTLHF